MLTIKLLTLFIVRNGFWYPCQNRNLIVGPIFQSLPHFDWKILVVFRKKCIHYRIEHVFRQAWLKRMYTNQNIVKTCWCMTLTSVYSSYALKMLSVGFERRHCKILAWYRLHPKILIISLVALIGLLSMNQGTTALPDETIALWNSP